MNGSLDWLFRGDAGLTPADWPAMLLGLVLSLACGHAISWVYMLTHSGLSYSRTFVNALVLVPPIVCLVMTVLTNNIITAFGMMAVFAIVRFRNVLRDTLDTTYVLISLVIGMAAGTQKFASAVIGCFVVGIAMIYLWLTNYGARQNYDLILQLRWGRSGKEMPELELVLKRYAWRVTLANHRAHSHSEGADVSYRLLLRNPGRVGELVAELHGLQGVSAVNTMAAQEESEI